MRAYYNEFNPEAAAMLRQLVLDGHIPAGDVDERSITEVTPDDIKGYTQCHFFAGIGGWPIALRQAGWPDARPVWTGSAPCQPFSNAGDQEGTEDERHLLPCWLQLIGQCQPPTIYGEQVAPAIAHGWLDDVYAGLEAQGYACGSAVLPAVGVGAPHVRERLWFVAHSTLQRGGGARHDLSPQGHSASFRPQPNQRSGGGDLMAEFGWQQPHGAGHWAAAKWHYGPDNKNRLVEPSIHLLADGFHGRAPIVYALGNAIVPQLAAQFITATMEYTHDFTQN